MVNFFLKYWLPLLLYASLIFYLSSLPAKSFGNISFTGFDDKLVHFFEYALLTFLIFRLLSNNSWQFGRTYCGILSVLLSVCYGMTDEVHQMFVPTRQADFLDLAADGLGALILVIGIKKGLRLRGSHP